MKRRILSLPNIEGCTLDVFKIKDNYLLDFTCNIDDFCNAVAFSFNKSAKQEEWIKDLFSDNPVINMTDFNKGLLLEVGAIMDDELIIYFSIDDFHFESQIPEVKKYEFLVPRGSDFYDKLNTIIMQIVRRKGEMDYGVKPNTPKHSGAPRF